MKKIIPFPEIIEVLSDGCKLMMKLPPSHPNAIFFNVVGHYLTRISCSIQTLKKIDYYNSTHLEEDTAHQDYQAILAAMRGELESSVDVQLLLQNPSDSEKVRDWEFCARGKTGARIIQEFGKNIPIEYQTDVLWLTNNQSQIDLIKNKYSWKDIPNSWHGSLIDGIHAVSDMKHREIFIKGYLKLYSIMNWGTHGSGTIIQSNFSPNCVKLLLVEAQHMISCSALMTMTSILVNPKIGFFGGEIRNKCDILSKYIANLTP